VIRNRRSGKGGAGGSSGRGHRPLLFLRPGGLGQALFFSRLLLDSIRIAASPSTSSARGGCRTIPPDEKSILQAVFKAGRPGGPPDRIGSNDRLGSAGTTIDSAGAAWSAGRWLSPLKPERPCIPRPGSRGWGCLFQPRQASASGHCYAIGKMASSVIEARYASVVLDLPS